MKRNIISNQSKDFFCCWKNSSLNHFQVFFLTLKSGNFWTWMSQNASCTEKLVTCIAQAWFWPFFHTNKLQTLKAPSVSFSSLHGFSIWFMSGDWLGHSSSFISFLETSWEFLWLFCHHCLAETSPLVSSSSSCYIWYRFFSRMFQYIFLVILP